MRHSLAAALGVGIGMMAAREAAAYGAGVPLVTGKFITPIGTQANVGSFPVNMTLSDDQQYVLVTTCGLRSQLASIRVSDGSLAHSLPFYFEPLVTDQPEGLYYGLAFGPPSLLGTARVYASRGSQDKITLYDVTSGGIILPTIFEGCLDPAPPAPPNYPNQPYCIAGIAFSSDRTRLYSIHNETYKDPFGGPTDLKGSMSIFDTSNDTRLSQLNLPGFPFAVVPITTGTFKDRRLYISSERDNLVSIVDPSVPAVIGSILVGQHPMAMALSPNQSLLYVANANSDSVSVVSTSLNHVIKTISLRPPGTTYLGCSPSGVTVSPDGTRLYVALADLNAVAVVNTATYALLGYIPTGWYPSSVLVSPDGTKLFVANAKGLNARTPNSFSYDPLLNKETYILNDLEGTVSTIAIPTAQQLSAYTGVVLANNRLTGPAPVTLANPGIKHVIYVIKENRSYDQVMGDIPRGERDISLNLFGAAYTPNQHNLALRFAQFDNFYCCAEVSSQGWNWTVGAMCSTNDERNTNYSYTHILGLIEKNPVRNYDFEGLNNYFPVDRAGLNDIGAPPTGYIWDHARNRGKSVRNYGCYLTGLDNTFGITNVPNFGYGDNQPTKRSLLDITDTNYRRFDLGYADSDAWVHYNCPAPIQMQTFGQYQAKSRIEEWRREFQQSVVRRNMPDLTVLRLPRDHTVGTKTGYSAAGAMIADNDYAVGQLVETVSHSPYWTSTAIIVVEDDAQFGGDHVDCHRSFAQVISAYTLPNLLDSRFYNTASAVKTIEQLLNLPPMGQYDAIAEPMRVFANTIVNGAPYTATIPAQDIICRVNQSSDYRSADSNRLFSRYMEESAPDMEMNDIMWGFVKGAKTRKPAALLKSLRQAAQQAKHEADDDD